MSHYRRHHSRHNGASTSTGSPDAQKNSDTADQDASQSKSEQSAASSPAHDLLVSLFRELFQTEQSAQLHPAREAERLGDSPPAQALRAVAEHAKRVLAELPVLAEKNDLPLSGAGAALGLFLSNCREFAADQLIETERSYRGTLLGVRHGVDLVELIGHAAGAQGNRELADWCDSWLKERKPMVDKMVQALQWFAESPEKATSRPMTLKVLGWLKSLLPQPRREATVLSTESRS